MRQVTHPNLYSFLFPVILLAASWSLAHSAVTEKLDNTAPLSAVASLDCAACETCPTPCGGVLPHPSPELPREEPPKQEEPHEQPSMECSPTDPSGGCLPQPYYYTTGKPNTLYPYKPYDYEYYNGGETRVQKLPMIMMLVAVLLSCWY